MFYLFSVFVAGSVLQAQDATGLSQLERLERALEQDPTNVMLRLRLGEGYLKAGDSERGQAFLLGVGEQLAVLIEANPDSGKLRYAMGLSLFLLGETKGAETAFEQAVSLEPDFVLASLGLAKVYMEQDSHYRAASVLQEGLERSPDNVDLRSAFAETQISIGKLDRALEQFEWLAERSPEDMRYARRLLELYIKSEKTEEAAVLLDRMRDEGKISETDRNLILADLYLDAGELREVPRLLQQVRRAEPEHAKLDDYFARFYKVQGQQAAEGGDWSRASLFFARSLEFKPDAAETRQALGSAYLEMGDFEAANEQFQDILESVPSDPGFYVDFARTQLGLKNPQLAFQIIEKAHAASQSRGDVSAMQEFEEARAEMMNTLKEMAKADESSSGGARP